MEAHENAEHQSISDGRAISIQMLSTSWAVVALSMVLALAMVTVCDPPEQSAQQASHQLVSAIESGSSTHMAISSWDSRINDEALKIAADEFWYLAEAALKEIKHPVSRDGALAYLVTAAAKAGDVDRAMHYASLTQDNRHIPGNLGAQAYAESLAGMQAVSKTTFAKAIAAVKDIENPLNQARSIVQIATWMYDAGNAMQGRELLADKGQRIALGETLAGYVRYGRRAVIGIQPGKGVIGTAEGQFKTMQDLADAASQATGKEVDAASLQKAYEESQARSTAAAVRVMFSGSIDMGDSARAFEILPFLSGNIAERDRCLQRLVLAHLAAGNLTDAAAVLELITDDGSKDFARLQLVKALARDSRQDEAARVAAEVESGMYSAVALAYAATSISECDRGSRREMFHRSSEVRSSLGSFELIYVKTETAIALYDAGKAKEAVVLLQMALDRAKAIDARLLRVSYLEMCAYAYARIDDVPKASEILGASPGTCWRNARGEIVALLMKRGEVTKAVEFASESVNALERVAIYGALAAWAEKPKLQEHIPDEPRVVPSSWIRWAFGMTLID